MPVAATVVVNFDGNSVKLQKELLQVERANRRAMKKISDQQRKAAQQSRKNMQLMRSALTGVVAALGVRELIRYADAWTNVGNRLRLVSKDAQDLARTQQAVLGIAQDTRSDLTTTAELYTRMSIATKDLNVEQEQNLAITKAVSQAAQLSGATTAQANAAVIQFTQGLAGGIFRAEEFNSVIENTPRLAQAMADGMGLSIGELRALVIEGELTAGAVLEALSNSAEQLEQEFSTVAPTTGQALTQITNAATSLVGQFDQGAGITAGLAGLMGQLAEETVNGSNSFRDAGVSLREFVEVATVAIAALPDIGAGASVIGSSLAGGIAAMGENLSDSTNEFAAGLGVVLRDFGTGARQVLEQDLVAYREELDEQFALIQEKYNELRTSAPGSEGFSPDLSGFKIDTSGGGDDDQSLDPLAEADLQLAALERLANDRIELEEAVQNTLLMNREAAREQFIQLAARQAEEEFLAALEARKAAHEEAGIPFTPEDELELLEEQGKRKVSIVQQAERERTKAEQQAARDREKIVKQEEKAKEKIRKLGFNLASTLIGGLVGESKGAALAMIAVNKGFAIAQTVMSTLAAMQLARATYPGPQGEAIAQYYRAEGALAVATIAATGLGEAVSAMGSGGGGVGGGVGGIGGGTFGGNQQFEQTPDSQSQITIIIEGDAIGLDEFVETRVVDQLREAIDERDVVVFSGQSRQAEVARSG